MAGIEFIRSLFHQASLQGYKSTALSPLGWALAILVGGLVWAQRAQAPAWISEFLGVLIALDLLAYLVAYFIFLFKSPEFLRSERYSLSKMAIEKSIKGDNIAGFFDPEVIPDNLPMLPTDAATPTNPVPSIEVKRKRGKA